MLATHEQQLTREQIEVIAGRKLRENELHMIPQLQRCKSDEAIRLLLRHRNPVTSDRQRRLKYHASIGVDNTVTIDAAA